MIAPDSLKSEVLPADMRRIMLEFLAQSNEQVAGHLLALWKALASYRFRVPGPDQKSALCTCANERTKEALYQSQPQTA